MPAYCDVDGVPCHASAELLTSILRDEWGFDGVVASDYTGIAMLATHHRMTTDDSTASVIAMAAGVDLELPRTDLFGEPLLAALEDGRIDERHVDRAVAAILRMKFRLGLFESPVYPVAEPADLEPIIAQEPGPPSSSPSARWCWSPTTGSTAGPDVARIAVIGPIADSAATSSATTPHGRHGNPARDAGPRQCLRRVR